jgi:putative NADPH-quinone reductase
MSHLCLGVNIQVNEETDRHRLIITIGAREEVIVDQEYKSHSEALLELSLKLVNVATTAILHSIHEREQDDASRGDLKQRMDNRN